MIRDIMRKLDQWRSDPLRVPVILRGARQVGKSWIARELGKAFDSFVEVNFEKEVSAKQFFKGDLDVKIILEKLSLYKQKKIQPGKTLLFFDEAQECPEAIKSLRYFKEELPELHVMAAGSLIDFALEDIGVAVGRVEFSYVYPLTFGEFLTACGRQDLRDYIKTQSCDHSFHEILLGFLKNYFWLGGMPEVVQVWLDHKNLSDCQRVQDRLLNTYKQDFSKYTKRRNISYVDKVFRSVPFQLGRKFKYANVDKDIITYQLKRAFSLLVKAGVIYQCFHSSGQGIPLGASKKENKFKSFFFDIGLAQRLVGLNVSEWITVPFDCNHLGSMAEQFVAQEMIARQSMHKPAELYYWHFEEKNSNAEVDFLIEDQAKVIPVEVKSGIKGGMKSLRSFLDSHPNSPKGIRISENLFGKNEYFDDLPLYGVELLKL